MIDWTNYRKYLADNSADLGSKVLFILGAGLHSEVGEFFQTYQKNLINEHFGKKSIDPTFRVMKIGDILWYLGTLENYFELPNNLYYRLIDETSHFSDEEEGGEDNIVLLLSDLSKINVELFNSVIQADPVATQYKINELVIVLLEICDYYKISIKTCLQSNHSKMEFRKNQGKENYNEYYKHTKALIKSSNANQLLIDIKATKKIYIGLTVNVNNEKYLFDTGNIIKDFYKCTLLMYSLNENKEEYITNYGPKFREFMSLNKDFKFAYLSDGVIKSADEIRKDSTVGKNNLLKIEKKTKPILINNSITTFDNLLDYIKE